MREKHFEDEIAFIRKLLEFCQIRISLAKGMTDLSQDHDAIEVLRENIWRAKADCDQLDLPF